MIIIGENVTLELRDVHAISSRTTTYVMWTKQVSNEFITRERPGKGRNPLGELVGN